MDAYQLRDAARDKAAALREAEACLTGLKESLAKDLAALETRRRALEAVVETRRAEAGLLRASLSWKVSAPLRLVGRLLGAGSRG